MIAIWSGHVLVGLQVVCLLLLSQHQHTCQGKHQNTIQIFGTWRVSARILQAAAQLFVAKLQCGMQQGPTVTVAPKVPDDVIVHIDEDSQHKFKK